MGRKDRIARSVTEAVLATDEERSTPLRGVRQTINAFFTIHSAPLHQHEASVFADLRQQWSIDNESYFACFKPEDGVQTALQTKGGIGYSGSTFFTTSDGRYLVKSVPRHFENSFFRDDLLRPYVQYMGENMHSLLIRITDFLAVNDAYKFSLGILLGFAPSHHIIMENLMVGRDHGEETAKVTLGGEADSDKQSWKWETWDLKPTTYFFPERDIARGKLASKATKSRLADEFDDKLVLRLEDAKQLKEQLKKDTDLLSSLNAVDYSLFLVRIPLSPSESQSSTKDPFADDTATTGRPVTAIRGALARKDPTPIDAALTTTAPPSWRTGITSADGKYVYRAAIIDFFWAKHKLRAKLMTHLVNAWNKVDVGGDKGPMSITTTTSEYKERFTSMCESFIELLG